MCINEEISGSEADAILDEDAMRTAEGRDDKYEYIRGTQEEKQRSTSCAASFWQDKCAEGNVRNHARKKLGADWLPVLEYRGSVSKFGRQGSVIGLNRCL